MNRIVELITKIARENIGFGHRAGMGMYNFDLYTKGFFNYTKDGKKYHNYSILQVYPYRENDFYGQIYLLPYYPIDDKENYDHDDYNFNDLNEEDQIEICNRFIREINELNHKVCYMEITKDGKKERNLRPFLKAKTLAEKVQIINSWEEDRGGEGEEYVYDLKDTKEREEFVSLYGEQTTQRLEKVARYWFGGNAFYANEEDKEICRFTKVHCVTEENADEILNSILGEIVDRYDKYLEYKDEYINGVYGAISTFSGFYYDLIDFRSFYEDENKPKKFRWIACSNDHAFEDESEKEFDTEEECYNDMRDHALEKMKWNTEYGNDLGDIVGEDDYINYGVRFRRDKIMHFSYSGGYLYKIVPSKKFEYKDYEELEKEISKLIDEEGIIL